VIAKQNGGMLRIWDAEQGKALFETKDYPKGSVRIISDLQCRRMVGIDEDYSAWVWDFSNGNLINKIDYNIWTADLSSNGQYLVTGSGNGMLGIWNAFNGQGIMFLEAPKDAQDKKSIWSFVKFDRNTNRVLAVNQSEAVIIDIANNPRESKFHRLIGQDNIDSGAFSPDGKILATVSWDGTTVVWDSDTGGKIGTVQSHQREDLSGGWVGFSSDSKKMVTLAGGPRVAKIWDIESMKLMTSIDGPRGWILAVGFDIKENRLITADKDGALRSWSLGPDIQKSTKAAAKRLMVADFDGDATRIATTDSQENNISVFDTSNGEVINQTSHKGARSIHTIAFSPDGRKVLSGGVGTGPQLWDLSSRDNPKDLAKYLMVHFMLPLVPMENVL